MSIKGGWKERKTYEDGACQCTDELRYGDQGNRTREQPTFAKHPDSPTESELNDDGDEGIEDGCVDG